MAVMTLAMISRPNVGAIAVNTAPPPKMTRPIRCILRRPTMSASLPIGIMNALMVSPCAMTTHETARRVTPKSSAICPRATNTIDALATIVTNEIPIAANAFHL